MSSTNTAAHQAVLALLRRGFGDNDTVLLLGGMTPDNQNRLVEGIGSTIDLSVAEATAAQKALEEQKTKPPPCRPMVAPSKILCESLTMRSRASRALRSRKLHRLLALKSIKLDVAKFGGAESDKLLRWLVQVSTAADAQRISDDATRVAFAMSHLKGRAEDWAFSKRLTDRHCFPSFAQGKRSLQEFIHDLRILAANINEEESLPEPLRVTVFMDGLNQGPARTQLFRAYPDTFEEAVRIALSESFSTFAHARAASSDMDVSMLAQTSDDRTCFNCGHPGHFSRAFPAPRRVASAAPPSHGSSRTAPDTPSRRPPSGPPNHFNRESHGPLEVCGVLTHSKDLASDTDLLLCRVGLQPNKMICLELVVPGWEARHSVLIDCGASNNYASRSTLSRFNRLSSSDPSDRVRVKMADGHTASQPRIIVDRWDLIIGMSWLESHKPWIDWMAKSVHKVTWLNASQSWIHRRAADRLPPSTTNPLGPPLEAMSNDLASPSPTVRSLAPAPATPSDPTTVLHNTPFVPPTEPPSVVIVKATLPPPIVASTLATTFIEETCNLHELPRTFSEILALPEMSFHSLVESLRAHDIAALAMITVEEETDLFSTSTADDSVLAAPLKSQTWDFLRSNPYFYLLQEFEDVFPDEVPCRLPVDKGVQHEIDLVPGGKYCVTRQWPLPRDQVDAITILRGPQGGGSRPREYFPSQQPNLLCEEARWEMAYCTRL
ncbi:hypothetical protein H257_00421 [Aphanomyces astaci]|uniref:CCHC-type domain-containing protein n=1 Tax=Aphanomyces astaci TaxID=112090 RepID=W4HAN5_APHAT|nr:hypothetical protein H257_00421 [Aphanomyces astaci]ETV89017.1 hypothetical protein H257_00421 [Aphanomyces astaci]|eukprot:XP_009821417.1 hypothetical protein H257_00421 [Aphanomyces astaci]